MGVLSTERCIREMQERDVSCIEIVLNGRSPQGSCMPRVKKYRSAIQNDSSLHDLLLLCNPCFRVFLLALKCSRLTSELRVAKSSSDLLAITWSRSIPTSGSPPRYQNELPIVLKDDSRLGSTDYIPGFISSPSRLVKNHALATSKALAARTRSS